MANATKPVRIPTDLVGIIAERAAAQSRSVQAQMQLTLTLGQLILDQLSPVEVERILTNSAKVELAPNNVKLPTLSQMVKKQEVRKIKTVRTVRYVPDEQHAGLLVEISESGERRSGVFTGGKFVPAHFD
ncbi:TA system antitoxin ParD family protein [Bacterioplanoides sp.]|uniref:TA system antitoxin ParD family protein n=1 Tax=Bacterioplanoides sp. TaxID=2066072 RepID=UPI003B0038E3